ncbi:cytochrome c peroxidase [Enhydrobacter aerosaccus]|uniref:Cytochrome c peroxidase n=1 Tax=Enhydrobacter aerosaccus TaxID=225324 RepID=A0A1T4JXJ2_9HYPH|nr:cytochrome c peroxidase [Enhydrobacter aerosaccus]SJZ34891.1 cytochrome c peroxidase [Enhydrobacter aerosaccus]
MAYARAEALTRLGQRLFFDPALSASGKLACATCHDPKVGFGPPNALAVQAGGKDLQQLGLRAVPSLKYLQTVPQFSEHYFESDDEGDASIDNGPTGGLTWDGRVDRHRDQAAVPLLSPFEMANATPGDVVKRLREREYTEAFEAIFGAAVLADDSKAFAALGEALAVYQEDSRTFYPYSSKYDAYLAGRARLTPQEARGLALFEDPNKGNCASCHRSRVGNDGTPPQFTDYGLIALGLPRNPVIAANADSAFFDLGLCGPLRSDLADRAEYCGLFRTPSLRNVALRRTFFHNGLVHDLRRAVAFYVERDTEPEKWYPRNADGTVRKFDDLPRPYQTNVNQNPPLGPRPDNRPVLTAAEIDDIVAFLGTLTDGFPQNP